MKTGGGLMRVMAYGDSLTWGRDPAGPYRQDSATRWTCLLQDALPGCEVIEEGLRGRMARGENPRFADRDGHRQFGPILGSQLPLDLVILLLGTNDLQAHEPDHIAAAWPAYETTLQQWCRDLQMPVPHVLLVTPPAVRDDVLGPDDSFAGAGRHKQALADLYRSAADRAGWSYFDASDVQASATDGVHLDAAGNAQLTTALIDPVEKALNTSRDR